MDRQIAQLRRRMRLWVGMLTGCTIVSVTLNVWHAMSIEPDRALVREACAVSAGLCAKATSLAQDISGVHPVLGLIFAMVPPILAACLSDALVDPVVGRYIKWAILGLFALSMATSIVSQASVMRPYGGGYNAEWSIPVSLDATALISLHMIMKIKGLIKSLAEKVDREADRRRLMKDIEADIRPDIEADIRRTFEADMSARVADIEEDMRRTLSAERADMERTLRADMERTLESERADIEEDMSARVADIERTFSAREADMEERVSALVAEREAALRAELEIELAARMRREQAPEVSAKAGKNSKATAQVPALSREDSMPKSSKGTLLVLLNREPNLTIKEQAKSLEVSEKTIQRWRKQLEEEGRLPVMSTPMSAPAPLLRAVSGGQ